MNRRDGRKWTEERVLGNEDTDKRKVITLCVLYAQIMCDERPFSHVENEPVHVKSHHGV